MLLHQIIHFSYLFYFLLLFVRGYFILKEACALLLRVTVTVCTSADVIRR